MDLIGKSISPFLVNRSSSSYRVELASDNEIISHLKFIGLIKKYNKINITTLTLQPIGPITKIKRTFLCYENNRRTALLFIDRTIARAFDLVKKYNNDELPSRELPSFMTSFALFKIFINIFSAAKLVL